MARPAAVIFDFGGVLTTPVWDSFASWCEEQGIDRDSIRNHFRQDPDALADLRQLESGSIEEAEFERRFAERLGLDSPEGLIEGLFRTMGPEEAMIEAVRALKAAGKKTALLSNSWSTSHYDRDLLAELFDAVVISGEIGLHKPQPEIYRLVADELGVDPEQCVFVDDLRENCEGAEAVGMTSVRHRGPSETLARLEELVGLPLGV